jgi:hypothetical protein
MTFKQGLFNRDTLQVTFGGLLSVDKNRFIAQAIKVPDFTFSTKETADAGGGCHYGYKETVTRTETNAYVIVRNDVVIGWMTPSFHYWQNHKTDLYPLDWKRTNGAIKQFAESLTGTPLR